MELYKFTQLNKEEQNRVRDIYKVIEMLKTFSNQANPNLFKFLFGESWEHFWDKFVNRSDHNLLDFFNKVDVDTKSIIIVNLVKHEEWNKVYQDKNLLYSQC